MRRCVQWGWTTVFAFRCGWIDEEIPSSIAISAVFAHCALSSILASRQEHTTTLYSINFFQGGIEKPLCSTSVQKALGPEKKMIKYAPPTTVRLNCIWNLSERPMRVVQSQHLILHEAIFHSDSKSIRRWI